MCSFAADPPPYIDGIRINSPHYLTKIKLTTPGTHTFTLVVSQYEKQNTIHYTVRVSQRMGPDVTVHTAVTVLEEEL